MRRFAGRLHRLPVCDLPAPHAIHGRKKGHLAHRTRVLQACEVQVWTLERFDREMGQPDRILLWLDIEGSELAALRGGPQLLASGRVRWINLEERRNGHCPAPGWSNPHDLHVFLAEHGYVRATEYARYSTHQDAIYVHGDERQSRA